MLYYQVKKRENGDIVIQEPRWDREFTKKTETVFSQCNGYMGVRASYELKQPEEARGTFLGGLYHQAGPFEVTELINCPDVTELRLRIDGRRFFLNPGLVLEFERSLNTATGSLRTDILYDLGGGGTMRLETERFASFHDNKLFCQEIRLTFSRDHEIMLETGINGQITNSGVSHFNKTQALVFDKDLMYSEFSSDSGQCLKIASLVRESGAEPVRKSFSLERRSVWETISLLGKAGMPVTLQKFTYFCYDGWDSAEIRARLQAAGGQGYASLFSRHREELKERFKYARIVIDGISPEEEGAIAFAQYHLFGMVPWDTAAYSVGAKGLTGEGYKGHVFWDTEMFVMPYFTGLFPEVSKNLLRYRYERLDGAREKARENGYAGALYPWESADTGREETPLYAALNIHTGKAAKVWSGIKEHHVTADIIRALEHYLLYTEDRHFMEQGGWEMILETACFWYSRAYFHKEKNRYEILDVIGPDEYTEHVDNNAYTNYLAWENVRMAARLLDDPDCVPGKSYLEQGWKEKWEDFLVRLYLPVPGADGLIPQDDTFLSKRELPNIEIYRKSKIKQEILRDFSRDQVVDMQVSKQADLVMLLNLSPERFDKETVQKNVRYYEARSVHDSSLSYCAHACACAGVGDTETAYEFFCKALEVDMDDNETDSGDGIHSAALGGILNCLMEGFAGVRVSKGGLDVRPHLPRHWAGMEFYRKFRGEYYKIKISGNDVSIEKEA